MISFRRTSSPQAMVNLHPVLAHDGEKPVVLPASEAWPRLQALHLHAALESSKGDFAAKPDAKSARAIYAQSLGSAHGQFATAHPALRNTMFHSLVNHVAQAGSMDGLESLYAAGLEHTSKQGGALHDDAVQTMQAVGRGLPLTYKVPFDPKKFSQGTVAQLGGQMVTGLGSGNVKPVGDGVPDIPGFGDIMPDTGDESVEQMLANFGVKVPGGHLPGGGGSDPDNLGDILGQAALMHRFGAKGVGGSGGSSSGDSTVSGQVSAVDPIGQLAQLGLKVPSQGLSGPPGVYGSSVAGRFGPHSRGATGNGGGGAAQSDSLSFQNIVDSEPDTIKDRGNPLDLASEFGPHAKGHMVNPKGQGGGGDPGGGEDDDDVKNALTDPYFISGAVDLASGAAQGYSVAGPVGAVIGAVDRTAVVFAVTVARLLAAGGFAGPDDGMGSGAGGPRAMPSEESGSPVTPHSFGATGENENSPFASLREVIPAPDDTGSGGPRSRTARSFDAMPDPESNQPGTPHSRST